MDDIEDLTSPTMGYEYESIELPHGRRRRQSTRPASLAPAAGGGHPLDETEPAWEPVARPST